MNLVSGNIVGAQRDIGAPGDSSLSERIASLRRRLIELNHCIYATTQAVDL